MTTPIRVKTIAEFHALRNLPKPKHPLISVINFDESVNPLGEGIHNLVFGFYTISVKRGMNHKYRYGMQDYDYDFNEGVMFFMAPEQVLTIQIDKDEIGPQGWMLMIHPDFLYNTSLAAGIKQYDFFDYSVNEALFLSEDEENKMRLIIENISQEYQSAIDTFSQSIIISQLETLLNYANRFYGIQFITRQKVNHEILHRLEQVLDSYIQSDKLIENGLPSVHYISEQLSVSPSYLRSLLKMHTGQSTQQLIHNKLIDKAKVKLSTTSLTVSQIAYDLGFEHPQSFSKLFKSKTSLTPLEFRSTFN